MNWRAESIQIDWQGQWVSSEIRIEDSHFRKSVNTKQNKQQRCLEIPQSREENLIRQEQSV